MTATAEAAGQSRLPKNWSTAFTDHGAEEPPSRFGIESPTIDERIVERARVDAAWIASGAVTSQNAFHCRHPEIGGASRCDSSIFECRVDGSTMNGR